MTLKTNDFSFNEIDSSAFDRFKSDDVIDDIAVSQRKLLESKPIEARKLLGQFFTGSVVSNYMASLVEKPKSKFVRILDAGAGAGILTASIGLRCLELGCRSVHAVLYELDTESAMALEQTMNIVQDIFTRNGASFTYEIHCEDFILSRNNWGKSFSSFDVSVINPPYFKYSAKESPYAKAVADLYRGDPNIYASFMAVVMDCLKSGGQMVSITPRSFTNGLYFKEFRSYLLLQSALDLVHVFKSRNKVFKESDYSVLQENIICRFVKGKIGKEVVVRSGSSHENINNANEEVYPVDLIIDPSNDQRLIRIPDSSREAEILRQAESLSMTFESAGYFISTGPVVEHRTRKYITQDAEAGNKVPLYRPHNITPLTSTWAGSGSKDVFFRLVIGHDKYTLESKNYVLLKRFSSKDERRRLVSGVYLASKHDCDYIGFGNKMNYIGVVNGSLSAVEAYGISAVFNSSFMDRYFRCISGNTQVNATEIRVMRFPSREEIKEIGKKIKSKKMHIFSEFDAIVNGVLGLEGVCSKG